MDIGVGERQKGEGVKKKKAKRARDQRRPKKCFRKTIWGHKFPL